MKKILFILTIISSVLNLSAQDWDKRHKFAKTYFGISNYINPNLTKGTYLNSNGDINEFNKSGFLSPAINIGATHFWGYADFYVSINTTDIKFGKDEIDNSFRLGTFTGLRIYPIPSSENSIRPYVGYKFSPFKYKQTDLLGQEKKLSLQHLEFNFIQFVFYPQRLKKIKNS